MTSQVQYRTAPARVHAFVDCPNCGRMSKPDAEIMVVLGAGGPDHVHCHFQCDRCGSAKRYYTSSVRSFPATDVVLHLALQLLLQAFRIFRGDLLVVS